METRKSPGRIITFYSYKGGTGRSMLLANTAWLLASAGHNVLMVDWDLEAPGLHRYMAPFLTDPQVLDSNGLIDMVLAYASDAVQPSEGPRPADWIRNRADVLDYAVSINWKYESGGTLSLLSAGRQGAAYSTKVNTFSWQNFYDRLGGFPFFEALKDSMRTNFDFILVDSRTGVSDTAGICTVQFPDTLVVCFTLNNQSIEGAAAVAKSVRSQRQGEFTVFPVATRLDNSESDKLLDRWKLAKERFADLIPAYRGSYWDDMAVLYVPKFAYEEVLAVFGNRPDDPANINLLSHARRLTQSLTGEEIAMQPLDEGIRSNVLAHFAGKAIDVSPLDAQRTALEDNARAEQARRLAEADLHAKLAAARKSGKEEGEFEKSVLLREEVERVKAAALRRNRLQFAGIAALVLIIMAAVFGTFRYERSLRNTAQAAVSTADSLVSEMKWEAALAEYNNALLTITDDGDLYAKRALVWMQLKKPEQAVIDFNAALALKPNNADLLSARADARMRASDFKGAVADSEQVIKFREDPSTLTMLAEAYRKNDQPKEAIDVYSKLIDKSPDNQLLLQRADLYTATNNPSLAIVDFARVAELSPKTQEGVFAAAQLRALGVKTIRSGPSRAIVYIQYSDDAGRDVVPSLRSQLIKQELQVARSAELKPVESGSIRYFHVEDAAQAKRVKEVVELALAERRFLVSLDMTALDSKRFPNAPRGQIEVWLPPLSGYDRRQQQAR